ncbi:enterobactin/ferric enterobactin esterase [Maioricimonas rarisocia]|uniref:Enterobactin/ferric enterobactin esterase n=1 Tax=Maioricimonas rarisocia TaxID=2528026 RepID=A0A517ZDP2_9PLAN|nr:alpha/beta hydrolase-fold protein [Maioricimonas rarisocia]QDU40596.1 enterobactin/ferric enterobactin esterase [Maioricimonas rarisocia]
MELAEINLSGPVGNETRRVWYEPVAEPEAVPLCLFLDAELYLDRVEAANVIDQLRGVGRFKRHRCVFVSSGSSALRHRDYTCHAGYTRFLTECVVPEFGRSATSMHTLVGLSLSGLAAAFVALQHSAIFSTAICQSPSAWWEREWLRRHLPGAKRTAARFWISVGDGETESDVRHAPTNMYQGAPQLDSCRRLAESLRAIGADVRFNQFAGGHDTACWRAELPDALMWAGEI